MYVAFTLTDVNGVTLSFQASRRVPVSGNVFGPAWTYVTAAIPQGNATFDYTQVAAYSVTVTNRDRELRWVHAYLDTLTAQPPSLPVGPASTRGSIYQLAGIQGTSHAPVSLQFQQVPTAGTPTTLTGNGTYTVPPGTITLKVEATGAGGAGASMTSAGVGGGGGGGEYAREDALPVSPGPGDPVRLRCRRHIGCDPGERQRVRVRRRRRAARGGRQRRPESAARNSTTGGVPGAGEPEQRPLPGRPGAHRLRFRRRRRRLERGQRRARAGPDGHRRDRVHRHRGRDLDVPGRCHIRAR